MILSPNNRDPRENIWVHPILRQKNLFLPPIVGAEPSSSKNVTAGELTPCVGYIAKLQARAAKVLRQFREDLKLVLITRKIVYWDDTVIFILAKRTCFRF